MRHKSPSSNRRRIAPVWMGIGLTALWFVAAALLIGLAPAGAAGAGGTGGTLMAVIAVLFPVALIWTAVLVGQTVNNMRRETANLRRMLEQLSQTVAAAGSGPQGPQDPALQGLLAEIAEMARQTDTRISVLTEQAFRKTAEQTGPRAEAALRDGGNGPAETAGQRALPLAGPQRGDSAPITIAEFIAALDFPKTADDREGFRILRRAMEDHRLSRLLTVAQDLLSDMSQDGIFMDDLHPDLPMARVWRRFARGERGLTISALGGIRDRAALTLIKARVKSDAAFRDKAHNFLREFDAVLRKFEQSANDEELNAMATTRSARAFMLLGRVAGTFD